MIKMWQPSVKNMDLIRPSTRPRRGIRDESSAAPVTELGESCSWITLVEDMLLEGPESRRLSWLHLPQ